MNRTTEVAAFKEKREESQTAQKLDVDTSPRLENSENIKRIFTNREAVSVEDLMSNGKDNCETKSLAPDNIDNEDDTLIRIKSTEDIDRHRPTDNCQKLKESYPLQNLNPLPEEHELKVNEDAVNLTYYHSPTKFSDIMKELNAQRDKGRLCDVVFSFEKKHIFAHGSVLAANSPYFEMQLGKEYHSNASMKGMHVLAFPTAVVEVANNLIHYMYTSSLGICSENMDELLRVACKLGMTDVIRFCSEHLEKTLNVDNWLETRLLAVQYQLESVMSSVKIFLKNHLPEVTFTKSFLELAKDDIFSTLENINVSKGRRMETKILNATLTWVCHSYETRKDFYPELLTLLNPELLTAKSVSTMLDLARFQDTGIASSDVSRDFISRVSNSSDSFVNNSPEIEEYDEINDEAIEESDEEYKPNRNTRKRPKKVRTQSALRSDYYDPKEKRKYLGKKLVPKRRKTRGRPKKNILNQVALENKLTPNTLKEIVDGEAKIEISIKKSEEGTLSKEDIGISFKNWSLTTADMDINVDQVEGVLPQDVAVSLLPVKKREIFTCPWEECTYETLYQKKLEHHQEWHSGVRQHICLVCGDAFSNDKHLTRHSKLHTGFGKKYDCQWCPYSSLRSDKLRDHIKNRHQNVALKLGLYEKGARGRHTKYNLDQQQIVKVEPTDDVNCEKDTDQKQVIEKKGEASDDETDIDSDKVKQLAMYGIVPKKSRKLDFSSMSRRSRTKRLVGKQKGIPVAPLLENVQATPKKPRGRPPTVVTGEKIPCPKCPKEFMTVNQMKHHLRGHGSDQPMLCEVCGFTTRHYCAMKLHMNVHAGDVLKCTWEGCDYQTARRPLMRDHINRHQGIKNHVCSVCGKAFTARKHMQRHEKTHSEFKPIACPVCEFRTTRNDKLREHLRVHHIEKAVAMGYMTEAEMQKKMEKKMTLEANKPCACSYCSFRTTSDTKLTDHIKKKHHEIAISAGVMSEQEWFESVNSKETKTPRKKKKEPTINKSVVSQNVLQNTQSDLKSMEVPPVSGSNMVQPQQPQVQTSQSSPYPKEEVPSPVSINSPFDLQNRGTKPVENIAACQINPSLPVQQQAITQQVLPPPHSVYHPSVTPSGQVVAIPQNHSLTHPHHQGHHTGTTTQVVTHHQPGTDLVPPYIASVMIEGVPVQLPPEMQAQLQNHWPYQ